MSITIRFSDYALETNETLIQRIQFVYSPLNELFRSLHVLLNPRHHGTNIDWVIEIQDKLTEEFYENLHYFQLFYELGVSPILLCNFRYHMTTIEEEIQNLKKFLVNYPTIQLIEYLERIIDDRENAFIPTLAKGLEWKDFSLNENEFPSRISKYLKEYRPDILVITGHDAYYKKKNDKKNLDNYQNSSNFVKTVKMARNYEKDQNKLIIISGACQSNYEELIKAGSNFASSPKRINIHALDPAIIASSIALSLKNESIDLLPLIEKTKYGTDGFGGIITNGTMFVGYPR